MHEAKTHFSKLIDRVLQGEEIVIARAGKPVARLIPVSRSAVRRTIGSDKIFVAPDFDEQLPDDLLKEFES
jgi:prevent-host-death family protein